MIKIRIGDKIKENFKPKIYLSQRRTLLFLCGSSDLEPVEGERA